MVLSTNGLAKESMFSAHKWDYTEVNPQGISFDFDGDTFEVEGLSTKL